MASVLITPTAERELNALIESHSLPTSTRARLRSSLAPLRTFPLVGAPLAGRWTGFRFLLGPWRWMIVVYVYEDATDTASVVSIQDGRSARSAITAG